MSVGHAVRRAYDKLVSLFRLELPERDVCVGTATAAAFNLVGMPLELVILRNNPGAPMWPELASMAVGAAILFIIATGILRGRPEFVRWLFVVNGIAVAVVLYVIDPHFATIEHPWIPFQASKLGAIVAGMLAPGFVVGLLTVAITVGVPIAQIPTLPPELQAQLTPVEPWALIAFGLGGVFVLAHRMRIRQLELRALAAQTEAEATRRLAEAYLALRDLMNTPLQSIELATGLLRDRQGQNDAVILEALRKSCDRLGEINQQLKKFEHALDWKSDRGGLG